MPLGKGGTSGHETSTHLEGIGPPCRVLIEDVKQVAAILLRGGDLLAGRERGPSI